MATTSSLPATRRAIGRLGRGVVALLLLAGPCGLVRADEGSSGDAAGAPFSPRYLLEGSDGRAVGNDDFPDRYQLVTFGYTSCADVCPTTLARMAQARRALGKRAARLQVVFITLDPARDTREALARYVAYFDAGIVALGGSAGHVAAAARSFHVTWSASAPTASGFYTLDHTSALFLLDGHGGFVARLAADMPPAQVAERIRQAMDRVAGPR